MNLARFDIEGSVGGLSPADERGFDAVVGETLSFRLTDGASNRVRSFHIQVYSPTNDKSPRCTLGAPLLTLVGKTSGQHVEASSPTGTITATVPGPGVHAWMVVGTVNGGRDENGNLHEDYRFARMLVVRNGGGARKILAVESTEYQPEGWSEAFNDLVDGGGTGYVPPTVPSVVYVNDSTGNDANAGTVGAPLKTIAGLVSLMVGGVAPHEVTVNLSPHAGSGYLFSDLAKITGYQGDLVIEGQGTTDVGSVLTVSSVAANVIDFGSPGFTDGAFKGAHLVGVTGANAGISRTILRNDADEIETGAFPNSVSAGDTFRIRLPAARITVDREATVRGGNPGYEDSFDGFSLTFINVRFDQPLEFIGATFSGQVYFYGCVITTGAFQNFARFSQGRFVAGRTTWVDKFAGIGYTDDKLTGWGLSGYKLGAGRRSYAQFVLAMFELEGCSFETTSFEQSRGKIRASEFESSAADPHGAMRSMNSYTLLEDEILLDTSGGAYASVLQEGGQVELLGSLTQRGATAAPWIARYPGATIFNGAQPTLTGQVQAYNGGKVRLVGVTGSTVAGGFQAGYGGDTAASFANAGDRISADDDSSVVRSA